MDITSISLVLDSGNFFSYSKYFDGFSNVTLMNDFDEAELALAWEIAARAARALDNARLFEAALVASRASLRLTTLPGTQRRGATRVTDACATSTITAGSLPSGDRRPPTSTTTTFPGWRAAAAWMRELTLTTRAGSSSGHSPPSGRSPRW